MGLLLVLAASIGARTPTVSGALVLVPLTGPPNREMAHDSG